MMHQPKRRGRPRLDPTERLVPVSISLPGKQFDELCHKARRYDISLPECIRRELYQNKTRKNSKA